jgi:hypothetical protein
MKGEIPMSWAKRIVIPSLLATFALSTIAVPGASAALPEFGEPFPNPFTADSTTAVFESTSGAKMTCTTDSATGKLTAIKKAKEVKLKFEGCKDSILNAECQTDPAKKGIVETSELEGTLGYTNGTLKKVGLDLDAVVQPFAKFECGGFEVEIKGDVIGELTKINTKTKLYTMAFKQTAAGIQEWEKLEGGLKTVLEVNLAGCGPSEQAALTSTEEIKLEKETEIKA